jgi:alpha-L-glutamate ligase-like protein
MNARNLLYVRPYNLAGARRLADDKLYSKRSLKKAGMPVPNLIAKIKAVDELEDFDWNSLPNSFVLKPNRGFGGEGILVIYGRRKNMRNTWVKADGSLITEDDLKTHVRNIIDGSYSLAGVPDIAFFEERLKILKLFKAYAFKGIPDIRIIVFNRVPVMAMLRIPTKASEGKANLSQGAIGVGIDLALGVTTTAVFGKNKMIEYVPGTRLLLSGIKIPRWNEILRLAVKAQEMSGLGYLGVDIAIDRERGPVFLELNARPGLSIQTANLDGLLGRLKRVEGLKIKTVEKGVAVGMNLFGGEIEEEIEDISGKKVIGLVEKVKVIGKNEKELEIKAKIDTGAYSTSIDESFARELGFEDVIKYFKDIEIPQNFTRDEAVKVERKLRNEHLGKHPDLEDIVAVYSSSGVTVRPKVKISFEMEGKRIYAKANIADRVDLRYPMIIGRSNLIKFFIEIK